jgi:HD-GYP domain-containing protein (c-di-GMP phosphodiesterase class II)
MVSLVDAVLRKWAHALASRSFYPTSHPKVRLAEAELVSALRAAHEQTGPLAISILSDQLLWGNEPLPSASSSGQPIQEALRESWVDRVNFDPGVGADEVSTFLDSMVAATPGQGFLRDTGHIRLEYMVKEEEREPLLRRSSLLVREIHETVARGEGLNWTRLAEVVGGILAITATRPQAILPLARIKEHDEYTFVHTVNVAILSGATARLLGCTRSVVHDIVISGILHDVGKQQIPLEILNKPGRLTEEEAAIVRRHPEDGARTLITCAGIPDLAVIVAYEHHQRSNDSGYPQTPVSWQPHLGSRVVQLADVFDALRTHRPYRAAMPVHKILEIFRQDAESFSDPELVRIFLAEVALCGRELESASTSEDISADLVQRL